MKLSQKQNSKILSNAPLTIFEKRTFWGKKKRRRNEMFFCKVSTPHSMVYDRVLKWWSVYRIPNPPCQSSCFKYLEAYGERYLFGPWAYVFELSLSLHGPPENITENPWSMAYIIRVRSTTHCSMVCD